MRKAAANGKSKHAAEQAPWPHHESLHIQNFTVFRDVEFKFNPRLNVFIGENGSGKTHLLKLMYAIQRPMDRSELSGASLSEDTPGSRSTRFVTNLGGLFQTPLVFLTSPGSGRVVLESDGRTFACEFEMPTYGAVRVSGPIGDELKGSAVLIPASDLLAHTRGFVQTWDKYEIDFDLSYRDIVSNLLAPTMRTSTPVRNDLAARLREVIGAEVTEHDERFYFESARGMLAAPVVAEGHRKLGTLYTLIRKGHLEPGSTLYWDEPDANLSPSVLRPMVGILLQLARSGVQMFLATHSYELLKEVDLQANAGESRYFVLALKDGSSTVSATDSYDSLGPNAIDDEFDSLYEREMTRQLRIGGR